MEKIKLEIVGLSYSQTQSGAYALVLGEAFGKRRLPIIIGGFEAQAIAIELEKMTPSRPLTHDLFKTFATEFKIDVKEVIIYNLVEGIFFAKVICQNSEGKEIELDARTSDAVALAVRFNSPIYTYEFILSSAGIILDDEFAVDDADAELEEQLEEVLSEPQSDDAMSLDELKSELDDALKKEDYERSSQIRDEINRRQQAN
ncbi:MAG: bifunctional nuclease domain-containing protein [Bacteroidota bacterium]